MTAEETLRIIEQVPPAIKQLIATVGLAGLVLYAFSQLFLQWRSGLKIVQQEFSESAMDAIAAKDSHIAALEATVSMLSEKMARLEMQVSNLARVFELLACLNAPTCKRRDDPTRRYIDLILDGVMPIEDIERGIRRRRREDIEQAAAMHQPCEEGEPCALESKKPS